MRFTVEKHTGHQHNSDIDDEDFKLHVDFCHAYPKIRDMLVGLAH